MITIAGIEDKKTYNEFVEKQYDDYVESGVEYVALTPFTHKNGGSVEILAPDCYFQVTINKPMEFDSKSLLKDFSADKLNNELLCAAQLMETCLEAKYKGIYYDKSKSTYHIAVKFNSAARYCIWKLKFLKVVPEAKGNKTVFEQCLQDACQRARKKIRVNKYYDPEGVKPSGEFLFKISSNKVFKAMDAGAITMEEATSEEFFEQAGKVLIQPKLDGTRGIAFKLPDSKKKISFKSKEGRDCDVGRVFDKEIIGLINILNEKYPGEDIFIDGEVYAHGYSRADITRFMTMAKNDGKRNKDLKYHVFTFSFEGFETKAIKRYKILKDIFDEYEFNTLELVEAKIAKDADTVKNEFYRLTKLTKELFEHNVKILKGKIDSKEIAEVQGGYEGIMIYHNEKYIHGEKRNGLRKLKYYQEENFELHDIVKEDRKGVKGKDNEDPKAMAVITYLGRTINIILTRTNAEKEEIYAKRKKYLKKYRYARIKFCAVTTDVNGDVNITGNSFVSFEE